MSLSNERSLPYHRQRVDACAARATCRDPLPDPAAHIHAPALNTPADVDRHALFKGITFALDAQLCQVCCTLHVLSANPCTAA